MATTSNTYTGNGTNKLFSITFPYLDTSDINVYLNGVLQTITTQYTFANATTVEFVTAPSNGAVVLLERSTDDTALQATFFPGSSIKANDLNFNFDQVLYLSQETANFAANQSTAGLQTQITAANNTSNTALTTANAATVTANTANTTANGIAGTANTALTNANAAVVTANTADSTANAATVIANSALSTVSGLSGVNLNRIINGDMRIAQRGTTFASSANNDDAYTLDRWYILSDGNDAIDVTRETSVVPANQKYAIALDVETANKKFGIAQIIESDNCVGLTGGTVTLSFKAKVSATTKLDNVKAAVVAWSGTADTVTSDIISAWGAEGTNPTLIANATYENTPANLSVTTSYATYSLTASVDTASTTNIIVFIWSDVTDTTAGDFLYVTDVQIEPGSVATPFEQRPIGTELALCQRYYEVFGPMTMMFPWGNATQIVRSHSSFAVTKRAAPTITMGSKTAGSGSAVASNIDTTGTTFAGTGSIQDVLIYTNNIASIEL
jgi:hypothetical protein